MPDRNARSEIHWRLTYSIGEQHACGDPLETNMPVKSNQNLNTFIHIYLFLHTLCLFIYIGIM